MLLVTFGFEILDLVVALQGLIDAAVIVWSIDNSITRKLGVTGKRDAGIDFAVLRQLSER